MVWSQMSISGLLAEDRDFCPSSLCGSAKSYVQETQRHLLYHFPSTSQELLDLVQEHIKADLSDKVRGLPVNGLVWKA